MDKFIPLYTINTENKLVVCFHKGKLVHNDYLNFMKQYVKDIEGFDYHNFNYLVDFGDIEIIYNEMDIVRLVSFLVKKRKFFSGKIAMVADTPNQVVVGKIFETIEKSRILKFGLFSTLEAAQNWLDIKNNIGYKLLQELKNKTI